jgi:GNAT superfamily N-acetyltransferase
MPELEPGDTLKSAPKIRPLEARDEAHWRRLWTGYLEYYETTVPELVYTTTFARLLSGADHEFRGLIAELDGVPVGLTHYLFHRHCWKVENICYLQDLYTDPSVRGKGIARALIEAVYAAADAEGSPTVWWLTQEFNYRGRMLYDQVGVKTPFIRYNRRA